MKVISSFVLLLAAVTVFASDSPPGETHQVLYLADAGVVVLRLSVGGGGRGAEAVGQLPIRCVESEVVSPGLPIFQLRLQASETLTLRFLTGGELLESTLVTGWFALNEPK